MSYPSLLGELSALSSADRTDRTVTLAGDELRMRYSPEPGIDVRIEGFSGDDPAVSMVSTIFEPGAERPAGYPPQLPYLPGLKASVTAFPDPAPPTVAWFKLPDPGRAAAEILAQSAAAGWRESSDEGDLVATNVRMIEMTRPGLRRTLIVSSFAGHGTLMLIDKLADAQDVA